EGWGCLNNMKAIVYFTDGSNLSLEFDGCSLIEEHANDSVDVYEVEIIPVVVAEPTEQEGRYDFKIQLRGIEHILDDIEKVVYDRNDPSFKQRYVTTYDRENNFEGGYNGWGCLYSLGVTIYYTDQTSDTFEINMCEELGW
ncbi:MAG TPA: pYEATS domain-containing protein, partial [Bacteroidia bacterium]